MNTKKMLKKITNPITRHIIENGEPPKNTPIHKLSSYDLMLMEEHKEKEAKSFYKRINRTFKQKK